jgi:hypothetical protein
MGKNYGKKLLPLGGMGFIFYSSRSELRLSGVNARQQRQFAGDFLYENWPTRPSLIPSPDVSYLCRKLPHPEW